MEIAFPLSISACLVLESLNCLQNVFTIVLDIEIVKMLSSILNLSVLLFM